MSKNLVPVTFDSSRALDFMSALINDNHYAFIGDHTPNASDTEASEIVPGVDTEYKVFSNIIQGKKVDNVNDVSLMVPRFTWASNTVYDAYTHVSQSDCHVVVESGATFNVYKCLDNNNGDPSTATPSGTDPLPFTTADGYVWKYMFGVDDDVFSKFATTALMPFVANTTNQTAAVPGGIEIINIDSGGVGYGNYFSGQLRTGDITSTTTFKLIETASNIANFYRYCVLKITNPDSPAYGEYRRVTAYSVVGAVKTITIESAFSVAPVVTDTYEIYPEVLITSFSGNATAAMARAIINPLAANTVSEIEVLTPGANHRGATASVRKDASVTITSAASLTPIISPPLGHGADPVSELQGNSVCVYARLAPSDTELANVNEFRQYGLLRDPRFDNVTLTVSGTGFTAGEQLIQYQKIAQLSSNTTMSSTTLTGNSTSTFSSSLRPGDAILCSNATASRLNVISAVANTTSASVRDNVGSISNASCFLLRVIGDGYVSSSNSTSVTLKSGSAGLLSSADLYGVTSQAVKTPSAITWNTKADNNNFVGMTKLVGTMSSGTIVKDEVLLQANGAQGEVYDVVNNSGTFTVYLTNVRGTISTGSTITGQTSAAVMNITTKYNGDLAVDQGQLVYVENVAPVTRNSSSYETLKIILEL
jgi:hypothetical protein